MRWNAEFCCDICKKTWGGPAGPTICPYCKSPHVTWSNFEKLRAENPWHGQYPGGKR